MQAKYYSSLWYQLIVSLAAFCHQPLVTHSGRLLSGSSENQVLNRLQRPVSPFVLHTSCLLVYQGKCLDEVLGGSQNHVFLPERTRIESCNVVTTYWNHSLTRRLSCAVSSVGSDVASVSKVSSRHFLFVDGVGIEVVLMVSMLEPPFEEI
jgi:hypothetical protein